MRGFPSFVARPWLAAGVGVVFAALTGAFGGCSAGTKDTELILQLEPDASCATAPVSCVNELRVLLEPEGGGPPLGSWIQPFTVLGGSTSLGDVPKSGTGRFSVTGQASLVTFPDPVPLFTGESLPVTLSGKKSQTVIVPVHCVETSDPCVATPTPTPDLSARFENGSVADIVLGQPGFVTCSNNVQGEDGALREPNGLHMTATQFWIAGKEDGRVAVFNLDDLDNPAPVVQTFAVGHNTPGEQGPDGGNGPDALNRPRGIAVTSEYMYVGDTDNHRIHLYAPVPNDYTDMDADLVLGQDNVGQGAQNNGGASAQSLNAPHSVLVTAQGLFVSDTGNHRMLHYTLPITQNKQAATTPICGQAAGNQVQANRGGPAGRNTMNLPGQIATDGTRLYLADRGNNRVLVWNNLADAAAGADPSFVLGQATFNDVAPNRGGVAANNTLNGPRGVAATPERLAVVDTENHRVLVWQPPPTVDGEPADEVLGQPDFAVTGPNAGSATPGTCNNSNDCPTGNATTRPEADTLFRPGAALFEGDKLWVSDTCNNRVLRYTPLPP